MSDTSKPGAPRPGAAQPGAPKPGHIVLARHGEPALSRKVKLTADEYRAFWAQYELGDILPGQDPPARLRKFIAEAGVVVSSTRLRAITSARTLVGEREFAHHEVLIEAPLPPPNLPSWIKLSPKTWGFITRVLWWYLDQHHGEEGRAEAEARADRAAALLIDLSAKGDTVVVLAHGFFNHLIGRALRKRGWNLVESEGYRYWSIRRFRQGWE